MGWEGEASGKEAGRKGRGLMAWDWVKGGLNFVVA